MTLGPWTHVPVLACALAETIGPIVEVGAGDHSTYLVSEFSRHFSRRALTIERHPDWFEPYRPVFVGLHDGALVPDVPAADLIARILALRPSVVFIDGDAIDRGPILAGLLGSAVKRIVVHDTDMIDGYPGVQDSLGKFRYRYDYRTVLPWTSVVSDIAPITLPGGASVMGENT